MTFNDQDKLRRVNKAVDSKADTGASREAWQELLGRYPTATEKSAQAARVISGLVGSWTAFYPGELGQRNDTTSQGVAPLQNKVLKVGQPGVPEVNFVPYSHQTNRFGSKGPSLLGHPISFSVVGPTLKSPVLDTQWQVTDNSASPGVGDVLTIDPRSVLSPPGGPAVAPVTDTIALTYGFSDLAPFPGGLYLVISQTGDTGLLDDGAGGTVVGGLGDGYIFDDGSPTTNAITAVNSLSKSEIFRVVAVGADTLTLDPLKRLASHFNIPGGTPALRAVTLLEPQVTRMLALPGSGAGTGRERIFATVPPERTANTDMMPPLGSNVLFVEANGTWLDGGFDEQDLGNSIGVITVLTGGEGYSVGDPVTIDPPDLPGGVQATAEVGSTASGPPGPASTMNVTNDGSGYTTQPIITFALNPVVGEVTVPAPLPDSIVTAFTFSATTTPIEPGSIFLTVVKTGEPGNIHVSQDDGAGGWVFAVPGPNGGAIDYNTGVMTISFDFGGSGPDAGNFTLDYDLERATGSPRMYATGGTGYAPAYGEKVLTPIPIPLAQKKGNAEDVSTSFGQGAGTMAILVDAADFDATDVGKVIHIHSLRNVGGSTLQTLLNGAANEDSLLGWFEVYDTDLGNLYYRLRRLPEVDPVTGRIFHGLPEALKLDNTSNPTDEIQLGFSLHWPVASLYTDAAHDIDKLESVRLTNLIDPSWVERSPKETSVVPGGQPNRADRAIFDTSSSGAGASGTNADPGSLLDLGFRMVLYPAKDGTVVGVDLVPDWDNPIMSNNVVLDPSLTESQSLKVDYASGLLLLSHDPVPGVGCEIAPNGIVGADPSTGDNPRGEIVLFAACVPYSREPGQSGPGMHIMGDGGAAVGGYDVFGPRSVVRQPEFGGTPENTITSGINQELFLDYNEGNLNLPQTGFVDLVQVGQESDGAPALTSPIGTRATTFGYCSKTVVKDSITDRPRIRLGGVYGGEVSGASVTWTSLGQGSSAVLRRDITTPNQDDGTAGADYEFDTTFGFAKRPRRLRMRDASLTAETDGSMTIGLPRLDSHKEIFDDLFSSWVISGGEVTNTGFSNGGSDILLIAEMAVLVQGVRTVLPEHTISIGTGIPAAVYVYVDTTYPNHPIVRANDLTIPLPLPEDFLLAKATVSGGSVTSLQDLRNPLTNMDRRLDILVGQTDGFTAQDTHFDTLREAIAYVGGIMDPAGLDGSYLRIKVVGYTIEDNSGAIILPANGVIVEGAGMPQEQVGSGVHGIGVVDQSGTIPTIDFNEKSDWVWRDLYFRWADGAVAPNADPARRSLFFGECHGFRFENIRLEGDDAMHGFVWGFYLHNTTFRNCIVNGVTDYGIYAWSNADNVLIENCSFDKIAGNEETALTDLAAVRLPDGSGIHASENIRVRDCTASSFIRGVSSAASNVRIQTCTISNTLTAGIHIEPHNSKPSDTWVLDNFLEDVWTGGTILGSRSGIMTDSGTSKVYVLGNDVKIGTISGAEVDIAVAGTESRVERNFLQTGDLGVAAGAVDAFIRSNRLLTGGITCSGDDGIVEGNNVAGDISVTSAVSNVIVSGNRVGNDISSAGAFTIIATNRVVNDIISTATDVLLQANIVAGDIQSTAALAQVFNNAITGNLDIQGTAYMVMGNRIFGTIDDSSNTGTDPDANGILVGNRVTGTIFGGTVAKAGPAKDNLV